MRHLAPGRLGCEQARGRGARVGLFARTAALALLALSLGAAVVAGAALSSVTVSPTSVRGGTISIGTVTLAANAGAGESVSLSSNNAAAVVPSSVTVPQGTSSVTFNITTTAGANANPVITAIKGAVTKTANLNVYTPIPPPVAELTEGNAASWGTFAPVDLAPTSVIDDPTLVKMGTLSLKFVTESGYDTGVMYPPTPTLHWDLTGVHFLVFWASLENVQGDLWNQPVVVLNSPNGRITYTPQNLAMRAGTGWHLFQMALEGDSYWEAYAEGTPDLSDVTQIEFHQDTWGAGFTTWYDGMQFVATLPNELTEGNASAWGTFASDSATTSVTNDTTFVRAGAQSIRFDTASGGDTGVVYPAAGNSHWDLSHTDSFFFWAYGLNTNSGGFQGYQPIVVLKCPGGDIVYTPHDLVLPIGEWRLYQVPLQGGSHWDITWVDSPNFADVNQVEIHQDTWGAGFTVYYDGVGFGSTVGSFTLSTYTVTGGSPVTGTVTLAEPAPAGGIFVTLFTDTPSVVSVPASITIPEGAASGTFTITTVVVGGDTPVWIDAIYGDLHKNVNLMVRPPPAVSLSSVSVSPTSVIGGNNSTGTVTLTGPADPGGVDVGLSSNMTTAATVPVSVHVNAGATTATFPVTTLGVASTNTVTLTATLGAVSKTATLSVTAAGITSVSLNPTSVAGGSPSTGTITLNGQAPPGGASVTVVSGNPSVATVTSPVVVPAGATTKTFTINTVVVATDTNVVITATYLSVNKTATLTVTAIGAAVASVSVSPAAVTGGTSSTGTVTLGAAAPAGGANVALSSNTPAAATVPSNVVVAQGATTATFPVTTLPVAATATATITATYNGSKSTTLTVNPAALTTVSVTPTSVPGEAPVTGSATLNGPAPAGGALVALGSNNGAATVPANVTVAANASSATFPVTTLPVATNQTATISGTYQSVNKTATLTVTTGIQSVSLNPATVQGGSPSTGTVTLTGPATTGGITVTLTSSNPSRVTVPPSIAIAQGATSGTFNATTTAGVPTTATITAAYGGMSKNATLTVTGVPTKLAFGTQPSNATGGSVITPAVTVRILDANNNLTTSTASVTVAIGTNPGGGTLSGTLTVAAVAGVATFSNLSINKIGTGYTLTAASTGLTGATSNAFNVAVGPAAKLAFGVQPTNAAAGASITPAVTVQIQDAGGNLTTSTASVTLAIGTNPSGGTLSGTLTRAASAGTATFSGLSINKVGTGYTLTAASTGLTGATSAPFNITVGAASKLVFGTQPSNATGGGTIAPAVTVQIQDANGNLTSSTAWVVIAIGTNPGGGTLSGTRSLAAVAGVATFSSLSINKIGTGYTMSATSLGLTSATSSAFNVTVGAAAKLAFGVQPTSVAPATSITPAVTVRILDAGGNLTASTASVTVAIGTNPSGGTLAGTKVKAAVAGTATFSGLSINLAGNGYTLTAAGTGLTGATSTTFNIGGEAKIRVETAADGTGVVVPAQNVNPGGSVTVYAISRDSGNAFVANAVVDNWTLAGATGGVAAGDLVPIAAITEYTIPTAVSYPSALAAGPDGNLWFAENNTNKIARVTPAGVFTEFTATNPNNDVWDMTTGPDGNLWFTEGNANKIGRLTPAGVLTEFTIPTANSDPTGIAAGSDGNLWFVEDNTNKIGRVTTGGVFAEFTIPTANSYPLGIAAGSDGNLWFTESASNKIGRITPTGVITEFTVPTSASGLNSIAAGPDGNLWFTEYSASKIGRVTTAGLFTEFPSVVQHPDSIVAGPDGNLWFTSTYPDRILARITTAGVVSSYDVSTPTALAAGPDGNVWFAEGGDFFNKIARFGSKGATFTGHSTGTGAIHAAKTSLVSTDSGTLTVVSGTPTKLAFGTQPSNTSAGSSITPAVTVQIQDANGNVTTSTASVTIAIGTNPAGGVLSGTATVAAVNGVATFGNLSINKTGTGYTLTAASTGLTGATSNAFNIVGGAATRVVFGTQPSTVPIGVTISPAVTVQILDAAGNLTPSTASVTVAIGTNPAGGVLSGTKTVNAVAGVATFSTLSIDKAGVGYTLTAASTGLAGATSTPFDIGAATKILVETKADGTGVVVPAQSIASGTSLNVFAIGRTPTNAFVANVTPDSWSLQSITGSVAASDLVSAGAVAEFTVVASSPAGIASGPDGNLWFGEYNGYKVGRITPAGVVTEFTVPSASSVYAITTGPDGNLWFTELSGRIGRITPAGVVSEFLIPSLSTAYAIAAGPDGNLWFTEYAANRIGRITPAGVVTEFVVPTNGSQPYGIAAGSDGALWFTESATNKIGRVTTSGGFAEFTIPTASSQPRYIVSGPDGNLWFTEYGSNKIGSITTAGVITDFPVPTASSQPSGITSGPDGALWFTEFGGNKVGRITTAGVVSEVAVSGGPMSIVTGPDQNLWFTEYGASKIGRVGTSAATPNGKAVFTGHKAGTAVIRAAKYGMTSTDSGVLTVPAGAANRLVFGVQPLGAAAGAVFAPALTVQILDANGNLLNSTASVTLAIGTNPGGGTLAGTKTKAAVAGVATFSDLSINKTGKGYTLTATSTGLTSATSVAFDIRPGAATKLIVETASDGTGAAVSAQSVAIGSTLTAWAISRDANNNFVANILPDSWSLTGKAGGVVDGDLVPGGVISEFPLSWLPSAITAGLDGNVWVTELGNGGSDEFLAQVTPAGSVWETPVVHCNVTSCSLPQGLAAARNGSLWWTTGINIYNTSGGIFSPPSFLDTWGITSGPDGNIWYAAYKNDQFGVGDSIVRITTNGAQTEFKLPTRGSFPYQIATGPDGNIWFTETTRGQIGRITMAGVITEFSLTGNASPKGIAPSPDGNVWFTEYGGKIGRMTPSGGLTEFTVPALSSLPFGIVAGSDGNVWFGEYGASRIGRISPAGVVSEFTTPTASSQPFGVTTGSDGNIWFTEIAAKKVGRLNPMIGSATLTGALAGTAIIHAAKTGLTSTDSGTITVAAAAATLALSPSIVSGANPSIGTVTLSAPAPAGGTVVTLSSSSTTLATVPASVTVAQGTTTKTFTVTPKQVYTTSYVTIKAVIQSVSYTSKLTLTTSSLLASLTATSLTVTGNSGSATGTVAMATTVPNDVIVDLATSSGAVIIPQTVTVLANTINATFPISVPDLTGFTSAILTATSGTTSKQAMLTVLVPHITSPVADPGSYTYPAGAPVTFDGWAQSINSQALDFRWVPFDPANAGGNLIVLPGPARVTMTPSTPQMRLVVTIAGTPQPSVLNATDACSGAMPGTCGWKAITLVPNRSCAPPTPPPFFPTVTGLTNFTTGSPPSISSTLFLATDRYSWKLEVESPPSSGQYVSSAVTQAAGPLSDGFDPSNRVWTPKLAGNVQLPPGNYRLQSLVVRPSGSCYVKNGWSPLYLFTVNAVGPNLLGLAPGVALPGEPSLVLYGTGFDATMSVSLSGPVYNLADTTFSTPLCDLSTGTCPQTVRTASYGSGGTLAFSLPTVSSGYYLARSRSSSGTLSTGGKWLRVDLPAKSFPVVPPTQHNMANRILPGQTMTGTFAEGGDISGVFGDYNTFYFFGTAGSIMNASVSRVDTAKPWQDPSALDPQLEIIAPDGLIYDNLRKIDDQPGVDYNASLTGVALPLTGVYYLRAETLKGAGQFQASLSFTSVAAAPSGSRAIPFFGNYNTVTVNKTVNAATVFLDPRGYPISGANVNFAVTPATGDTGAVTFVTPPSMASSYDGSAVVTLQLTAQGKVQITPSLTDTILAQWILLMPEGAAQAPVPRFAPTGLLDIHPFDMDDDGTLWFDEGRREELPLLRPSAAREERDSSKDSLTPANPRTPGAKIGGDSSSPGHHVGPTSAEAKAPVPIPVSAKATRATQDTDVISSCGSPLFVQAGATFNVLPPLTMTLTDMTPSTGGTIANGPVDSAGIHGHRIEKTIRMKIDIKDASGGAPNYPVLVHLAVAGPAHGTLFLDPDGARVQCSQASFLWHERNAQNQIIALNEEFEYKLGTLGPIVGFVPDTGNPGHMKPVFGTPEVLGMTVSTVDSLGVTTQLNQTFKVHPEPGKPDHFSTDIPPPPAGTPDVIWSFWPDYHAGYLGVRSDGQPRLGETVFTYNSHFLFDVYDNLVFGYTNLVQPTPPATNLTVGFGDQITGSLSDGREDSAAGYVMNVSWTNDPVNPPKQMPSGPYSATLKVNYPVDPEWPAGSVSKTVSLRFDVGTFRFVEYFPNWDCQAAPPPYSCVAIDPSGPWTVSPGADGDALPKSLSNWDEFDPNLHTVDAARANFIIGYGPWVDGFVPFNYVTTWPETADAPAFKVSLVDASGKVAKDASFQVHLCPRYDHFTPNQTQRPCTLSPVQSVAGVVASVRVNSTGPNIGDAQALLGVQILHAPSNPGDYYVSLEALEGKQYRLRQQGDHILDETPAGEYKGAWWLLTVSAAEILDENFQRANPIVVRQLKQGYVRFYDSLTAGGSQTLTVKALDSKNNELGTPVSVEVTRVGTSRTFIGPIALIPDGDEIPQGMHVAGAQSVAATGPTRTLPAGLLTMPIYQLATLVGQGPGVVPYQFKLEFADASNNARTEQFTVVEDKAQNFAEKTYVRITVRDPHKGDAIVPTFNGCGYLQELANTTQDPPLVFTGPQGPGGLSLLDNNLDNGGDLIFSPNTTIPEGAPGLKFDISNGISQQRNGEPEAAFLVRAVARYRTAGGVRVPDFAASLKAVGACGASQTLVDPSNPLTTQMWVDQVDYFPRPQAPTRHADRPPGSKISIDWIEKETRDLFDDPNATPIAKLAFDSVTDVWTDVTGDNDHRTGDPYLPLHTAPFPQTAFRIHINPTDYRGFRWGAEIEDPARTTFAYKQAGFDFFWERDRFKFFELILTHESRHALQFRVTDEPGATNSDQDWFVLVPTRLGTVLSDGSRIADTRNARKAGSQSEFDLSDSAAADAALTKSVIERDALRHEYHSTKLDPAAIDVILTASNRTIQKGTAPQLVLGTIQIPTGYSPVGIMVKATVVSGTSTCTLQNGSNPASTFEVFSSDANGNVSGKIVTSSTPGLCTIRLNMVKPASLASGEIDGQNHDIAVTVQ